MKKRLHLFVVLMASFGLLNAQSVVKDRAYYENLGDAVADANYKNAAGEDPLYGGGHGFVIRASVSPTWTAASLAGSGLAQDPNKDQFGLTSPYRAIFKDDYCNRTGYFTHDAPTRVYLGGFKPIGEGGVEEDVYFTVLRTGTANATADEEWQGRGTSHLDLRPNGTTGYHNGELIGGYVVVGKGLTPTELVALRAKIDKEENGNAPTYSDVESSFRTGLYNSASFCSETAAENAASYTNVSGGEQTITIPSFIMLDQEFADPDNELGVYKGRHIILKVVGIDFGAFSNVENTHFILPKGITYIGDSGLRQTGGGTNGVPRKISFHTGSNVYPFIGEVVDADNENWADNNNIESLGRYSFSYAQYQGFDDIVNVNKIAECKDFCFQGWANVTNVNLAAMPNLTKLGRGAFMQCPDLEEVQIGPNMAEIGDQAFSNCPNLTTVSFVTPEGDPAGSTMALKTIGAHTFEDANRLSTFVFPESLKNIGEYAFSGCNLGAGGRFDLPASIDSIGRYAFANNGISYIPFIAGTDEAPENPVGEKGLFLGYRSFYEPGTDVTVEFNAFTPPCITSEGRPFETDDAHRVRIIVPLSSGECYKHGTNLEGYLLPIAGLFSKEYNHHEYRVKFDLRKNYVRPNYGHYATYDRETGVFAYKQADWWVASTSWTRDTYILKPAHGGTVDTWASSTTTNNLGASTTLWTPTIDYYIDPDNGSEFGTRHIFPRTAHQYFDNGTLDSVPKISTLEVEDGIMPPDEGLLLAYTQPAYYLVPLYADYGLTTVPIKTVPQKFGVEIETVTVNDPSTDLTRVRIHNKLLTFDSDEMLQKLAGSYWLDFNDHTAKWRQIAIWNDAGTDFVIEWIDLLNHPFDSNGNPVDFNQTVKVNKTFNQKWDGQKFVSGTTNMKNVTVKKYDYWTNSSNRPYRCAAGWNKFMIPYGINWAEACEEGPAFLRALLGDPVARFDMVANYANIRDSKYIGPDSIHKELFYLFVPCTHKYYSEVTGDTVYCGNTANNGEYGKAILSDWHCRQWIDIFELIHETGLEIGEVKMEHCLQANLAANGNILVPCVEPTYVWPFWVTVDDATYEADSVANPISVAIARRYYQDDQNEWLYSDEKISGRNAVQMDGDNYAEGFISFGLSNGYFVQTKNPGYTKANRSYFRVPSSVLHTEFYKTSTPSQNTRMVIVDEADISSAFDEVATGLHGVTRNSGQNSWFTIDGRRLKGKPMQSGVYLNNGRKIVIP